MTEDELIGLYNNDYDTELPLAEFCYEKGRADERAKVIEDVHKAMANKYHCKEDLCEVGMTCADCLKKYMEDLYSDK